MASDSSLGGVHDFGAFGRVREVDLDLVDLGQQFLGRGRVLLEQVGREVLERLLGPVGESDRFLDLEVPGHLAVGDAPAVLDGHEFDEPVELGGTPDLVVEGQRRGDEGLELALDLAKRPS